MASATSSLFTYPKFRAATSTGVPLNGGLLYTYAPGPGAPKATYSDDGLTTPNANPVVLDANGEAVIYLDGLYDMTLKTALGVEMWTMQNLGVLTSTYEVDALADYGDGTAFTQATIEAALTAIGTTNQKVLLLTPGTWVISTNADWSAYTNITFKIVPGAILQIATGTTTTIPKMLEDGLYKRFDCVGTGKVLFGSGAVSRSIPQWFGASKAATAAVNSVAFQRALDSIGTYPSIPLYVPGVSVGSVGAYQVNTALTKTSADWIRITGDGPSSWLEWTGADYATILSLTGLGSGMASVDGLRFDCNGKATTGLQMKGFGHEISVTKCMFNDGLANVADDQGMLNIPIDGETHNGLIRGNWFSGGTAIGLALGVTGASSGSGGFDISVNEFQQINNWAIKSDGLKESSIRTNIVDNLLANTNAGGFNLDSSSGLVIDNNHVESLTKEFLLLNPTAWYAFFPITAKVTNNFMTNCAISHINLGYTDGVVVDSNTIVDNASLNWLTVTANAKSTIVGKNQLGTTLGALSWHEQYITGAGLWANRFAVQTVASTASVYTSAAPQNVSANWVSLTPLSTLTAPDIPVDARGYIMEISISSATVGARLYIVNEGNAPAWADRATDERVKYVEAQAANRSNVITVTVPVKNQSYVDSIQYGISDTGAADTSVKIKIVGYLMPT